MGISSFDYEKLTQALYRHLLKEDGFDDVQVKHDVFLTGKSGAKHQIDVYWSVEVAGVEQGFCVECKNWNSTVKKEHVAAFAGKIEDIGCVRGVFVTTAGYQKGAIQLADYKGISLIRANYQLRRVLATLQFEVPEKREISIEFEEVQEDVETAISKLGERFSPDQISLFDHAGTEMGTLGELLNAFEHQSEGYYEQIVNDRCVRVQGVFVKIENVSYFYRRNIFPKFTLQSEYEIADVFANDILDNREIRAVLNTHKNDG
jgi:hypothetical protein